MNLQRKLIIGFLTFASIFSGTLAYRTQMPVEPKTDLVISKDTANEETVLEDNSLSELETNPESIPQTPDKTEEKEISETENLGTTPENTNNNIDLESAKNQNVPKENSPVKDIPVDKTPAKDNTAKETGTENNTGKTPPTNNPPVENPPSYNAPKETPSVKETQTVDNSTGDAQANNHSTGVSKRNTITYEELEKYIATPTTPVTPAPEASVTNPSNNSSYANQVLSILNQERTNAGLSPLTMNQSAVNAASVRAKEIVSSFSHTRPSGQSPFTALDEAGVSYRASGENIACGQKSPSEVMTGWMNSSGHRANILSSNFTQVGIACYEDPNSQYGYYWVQLFIG